MELELAETHVNLLQNGHDNQCQEKPSKEYKKDAWGNRMQFLLAIIGYTVGIGSIWRFPVLCARNGAGAFLIPFFFFMVICGFPLYYMEVSLGQFTGQSAGLAFDFCPLFKGVGMIMLMMSFLVLWYYLTIMAWVLYYFINSFRSVLPWSSCGNWWNTEFCREDHRQPSATMTSLSNETWLSNSTATSYNATSIYISPATEFWEHNVLRMSSGLEEMGEVHWHLVISSFIGWILVVGSLIKGVRSLGKVVYVTATAPYVLLTVLLIRGLTLDGAADGVLWYITPDFSRLAEPQVWLEAAIQVSYSLGPGWGGVITMASHNKFHQKSLTETTICVVSDAFTAFYAGLVVFTCLGFLAKEADVSIEEVAKASGPGLAFVAYPEAISRMPMPQLWGVLFFLTLITVAFDSAFGMVETVSGSIVDMFPHLAVKHKWFQSAVLIGTCLVLFLGGMPFYMSGGIYLFQLADWYGAAFGLLFVLALESIMIGWLYGADRFSKDIELMTGRKASKILRIFWCISLPFTMTLGFVTIILTYSEPNYGVYIFKPWAIRIGFVLAFISFVPFFVIMVKELLLAKGPFHKRFYKLLETPKSWGPSDPAARQVYESQPYRYEDTLLKRIKMNILGDKTTPWI